MKYLLLLLFLTGCEVKSKPDTSVINPSSNPKYSVTVLFEHEGCKVYRFEDFERSRYFTNCSGSTEWTHAQRSGKHTTYIPEGVSGK